MPVHFLSSSDLLNTHSFFILFYIHSYLQHEKKETEFDKVLLGKDRLCSKLMEEAASYFNRLKISQRQHGEYVEKRDDNKHQVKKKANQQVEATKVQYAKKVTYVDAYSLTTRPPWH